MSSVLPSRLLLFFSNQSDATAVGKLTNDPAYLQATYQLHSVGLR